jgi:hypothetical protein
MSSAGCRGFLNREWIESTPNDESARIRIGRSEQEDENEDDQEGSEVWEVRSWPGGRTGMPLQGETNFGAFGPWALPTATMVKAFGLRKTERGVEDENEL